MTLSGLAGLWPSGVEPVLDLSQVCLIGARDFDPAEQTILATHAVPVIEATSHMSADIRDFIGDEMVYVHVDCDVLDIPYTSTEVPVPRGMTPQELLAALTALPRSLLNWTLSVGPLLTPSCLGSCRYLVGLCLARDPRAT